MNPHSISSLLSVLVLGLGATNLRAGQEVFFDGFDSRQATQAVFPDTARYRLATDSGRTALSMRLTDSAKAVYLNHPLALDQFRGGIYRVTACSRAFGLTAKSKPYNGVKVMVSVKGTDGTSQYPQMPWPDTLPSYPWQNSSMIVTIPDNTLSASLVLGLEAVAGTVLFDSVRMEKIGSASMPAARDSNLAIPMAFGIRLRGAMIGVPASMASLVEFGSVWKGNLLRWQLNGGSGLDSVLERPDYDSLLRREMALLDSALPVCRQQGIKLVVDMHQMASGLFLGAAPQSVLIDAWKRIATRYKGSDVVAGYDLANEPAESQWRGDALLWNEMADTLCRAIRAIDPLAPLVVEPVGGDVSRFSQLRPVGSDRGWDLANIVYSFHFYTPYTLTHQGISASHPPPGAVYPGVIDGLAYDQAQLSKAMQPAVDFQNRYRVPIYVGEFSCIRWAPDHGALRWLADVTTLLESRGWDWSYHAFREYHGWSVEYSDSLSDLHSGLDTDRKALLTGLFQRNANPYSTGIVSRKSAGKMRFGIRLRPVPGRALRVESVPAGARLEVRRLDGSLLAQLASPGVFAAPGAFVLARLTGSVASSWILLSTMGPGEL